jgi:hypothetical protein
MCNRSGVSASFATLPPLTQLRLCCIDRLNPHTAHGTRRVIATDPRVASSPAVR